MEDDHCGISTISGIGDGTISGSLTPEEGMSDEEDSSSSSSSSSDETTSLSSSSSSSSSSSTSSIFHADDTFSESRNTSTMVTNPLRPRPSNKRRRGRYFPPIRTKLTTGPFPGDGDEYFIGPNQTLRLPSYYAMSGYAVNPHHYQQKPATSSAAVVPEEEPSPSAASWAATIPSPNATKLSPEQITTSPSSPLSINWFCRLSINKHYPVKKGFGGRVPPIHWRGSEARMTVWRRMTRKEQDEEWSRWSTLPYEIRKAKTEALERIQARVSSAEAPSAEDDSPGSDPPKDKIALTLSISTACQTDEHLLDFRDAADCVIIERLSKRAKTSDAKVKAAPPAPMPSKPRAKSQSPTTKPPVAEVTVARTASVGGGSPNTTSTPGGTASPLFPEKSRGRESTAAATRPSQKASAFGNRHHYYGLAPRYSSYHDPRGHFSYPHHMSPPQASAPRLETTADISGRADTGRSLFDVAAHHQPTTPTTSVNRQINNEEYDRIQRNESARHLIRLLS